MKCFGRHLGCFVKAVVSKRSKIKSPVSNTDLSLVYYKIMDDYYKTSLPFTQVRQKHSFLHDNICYYWAVTHFLQPFLNHLSNQQGHRKSAQL